MWRAPRIHTWTPPFILYMNDNMSHRKTILFADDATCFDWHKSIDILCKTVNNGLKEMCTWFEANKLSLIFILTVANFLG